MKLIIVPDRVWTINDLTEEEIRNLHVELDYIHDNERWWEQEPLKILDLSCNSLKAIDSKVECLMELTTLYVSIVLILFMKKLHMKSYVINFYNFYSYTIIYWKICQLK